MIMKEFLSIIYFFGLCILGVSVGSYYHIAEYAFMIIGCGSVLYAIFSAIFLYLG